MRNHLISCAAGFSIFLLSLPSFSQTSQYRVIRTAERADNNLATPSPYFSPQSGTQLEFGYSKSQMKMQTESGNHSFLDQDSYDIGLATAVTSNFYIGLRTHYETGLLIAGSNNTRTETKMSGVGDPSLFLGGRLNFTNVSILSEVDYQIGSGDADVKMTRSGDFETNAKQGGDTVTPRLSIFRNQKDSFLLGADVSYGFRQERTAEIKSDLTGKAIAVRTTGGNVATLSVYAESPQITHSMGVLAAYTKVEDSKQKSLNSTTSLSGVETGTFMAYANLKVKEQVHLQPAVAFNRILNPKENLENQSSVLGSLNARISF